MSDNNNADSAFDATAVATSLLPFLVNGDVDGFHASYRAVHATRRANVMGAMILDGSVPADVVIGACNSLQPSAAARVTEQLPADSAQDILVAIGNDITRLDLSTGYGALGDEFAEKVRAAALKAVMSVKPGSGTRTTNDVSLTDVQTSGKLPIGATIVGKVGDKVVRAKVNAADDGTAVVKVGNDTFTSLSAAAVAVVGHQVNGWKFWSYNDQPVGSLR